MSSRAVRNIGEAVALIGVVASLVFVGLEIRENRIAARAAAYQELGIAVAGEWMARAGDRELNDLVRVAASGDSVSWAGLSESDVYLLRSYTLSAIRLFETAYLQVEQDLLDEGAMERLGWRNFLESNFLMRMWPEVRSQVSPAFTRYLETQRPDLVDSRPRD